jgi:hypothetical protein
MNQSCVRIKVSRNSSKEEQANIILHAQFGDTKVSVRGRAITIRYFPRDEAGVPAWALREVLKLFFEFAPESKS